MTLQSLFRSREAVAIIDSCVLQSSHNGSGGYGFSGEMRNGLNKETFDERSIRRNPL